VGITAVLASIHSLPPLVPLLLAPFLGTHEGAYAPRHLLAAPPQVHEASGDVMDFWQELREWQPRSGLAAPVSGLVLARDAAEFHLDEGTLTLLDLRGRTAAAVFEGSGRVRIEPPLEVERKQLERYLGQAEPEVAVDRLFFLFADSTVAELRAAASFTAGPVSDAVRDATRDAVELLVGGDEGEIPWTLVRTFLNDQPTRLFRAHIFPRRGDDLYFVFDASAEEEVEFGRKANHGDYFEALASFHIREAYDSAGRLTAPQWQTHPVDAMSYVVQVSVKGLDEIRFHTEALLVPNVPGGSWVGSTLLHSLEVDSLRWKDGSAVRYDRSRDDVSTLWIRLPDDAVEGLPLSLEVWYGGEILERDDMGFYYLRSASGWLPQFPGSEPTYDLTFRSRRDWTVMSVGKRITREIDPEDGDVVVTRWMTSRPSSQVTFSVGDFEEYEFTEGGSPIRIHVAEEFHARLGDLASRAAEQTSGQLIVLSQSNPEEKVHLDIRNSLAFFSQAFGPLAFEEYNVAEIPFSHGQAFPGMINLSWLTFQWTSENGLDELFRAHEVAHQWWGIGTRPRTYHDIWLSEGLSEFSALWYMHKVRANPERYLDRLDDLRESILDRREEAGPIWLGPRLDMGREGEEDYTVTVYSKGAWVLHMLRNLMLDHDNRSEELFDGFMKVLFERFKDHTISTDEFQALLETYLQTDMTWFFEQWVYGTDIPTYRFAYTTEELPGGEVRMRVRVRQEDVPESFMMPVPVLLDFGEDGTAVVTVLVKGGEVVTDLPILPRVPDEVTFNVLQSVLAEVHTEKW
jgi:hypothetical protein